jgi:predicted ATP-grasp superfamily ATP-dependent carboligase
MEYLLKNIKKFDELNENSETTNLSDNGGYKNHLDINNNLDVNKIMKFIEDQSMEWAYGQGTTPGEEREMVSQSFIEGAKLVISILKGEDQDLIGLINDIP